MSISTQQCHAAWHSRNISWSELGSYLVEQIAGDVAGASVLYAIASGTPSFLQVASPGMATVFYPLGNHASETGFIA